MNIGDWISVISTLAAIGTVLVGIVGIWDSNRIKLNCVFVCNESTEYVPILKIHNSGKKVAELESVKFNYKGKEEGRLEFSNDSIYSKFSIIEPNSKIDIPLEIEKVFSKNNINAEKTYNTPQGRVKNKLQVVLITKKGSNFSSINYYSDEDVLGFFFLNRLQ